MSRKSGKSTNRSSANITNYFSKPSPPTQSNSSFSGLGEDILDVAIVLGTAYLLDKVVDKAIDWETERQEKLNKLYQLRSIEDDLYLQQEAKRSKLNRYNTETALIQTKVNLGNQISNDYSNLPGGWKGAITHGTVSGGTNNLRQQIFNEELENLSVQEKQALLYKLHLQNQLDEHRNNQKMGYSDDQE